MDEPTSAVGGPPLVAHGASVVSPLRTTAAAAEHRAPSAASIVQEVLKWAEVVGAPVAVSSALLVFFGSTYSRAYFGYFGVDQRLLQYSVQDQVLLSADVLFGTAVLALVVLGVIVVLDRLTISRRHDVDLRQSRWDRLRRRLRFGIRIVGGVALATGLLSALRLPQLPAFVPLRLAAMLILAGAVVLLRFGTGSRRGRMLLYVPVVLAAFWITTLYAENEGVVLARQIDDNPAHLALVTLYSARYLDLPGTNVVETEEASPTGQPLYRYGGLRLLAFSNNRWFLITGRYDGYRSTVAIVANADDVRAEVAQQRR